MLEQKLKRWFGFSAFKTGQKQVIEFLIRGQSTAAIFPTGSDKSLSHQIQALLLPHLTLITFPFLAVKENQMVSLKPCNASTTHVDNTFVPVEIEYGMILNKAKIHKSRFLS